MYRVNNLSQTTLWTTILNERIIHHFNVFYELFEHTS